MLACPAPAAMLTVQVGALRPGRARLAAADGRAATGQLGVRTGLTARAAAAGPEAVRPKAVDPKMADPGTADPANAGPARAAVTTANAAATTVTATAHDLTGAADAPTQPRGGEVTPAAARTAIAEAMAVAPHTPAEVGSLVRTSCASTYRTASPLTS